MERRPSSCWCNRAATSIVSLLVGCAGAASPASSPRESKRSTLGFELVPLPTPTPTFLAATELPRSAFAAFVDATGHVTTAERSGGAKVWSTDRWKMDPDASWRTVFPGPSHPVTAVSWHDAVAFCQWLTEHERAEGTLPEGWAYRLPTDAEWELGARAGTHSVYSGTDTDAEACRFANVPDQSAAAEGLGRPVLSCDDGVGIGTSEVGRYEPNAWGLHDMTGNVWEWTSSSPRGDPDRRMMRGGSWSGRLDGLRIDRHDLYPPDLRGGAIGFRVLLAARPRGRPG